MTRWVSSPLTRDVPWVSGPAWVDLANPDQRTHLLQQCCAPVHGFCPWRKPLSWPSSGTPAPRPAAPTPMQRRRFGCGADALARCLFVCVCVCCVVVGCMSGTPPRAGCAFGSGGVLLLHREWDSATQRKLLHRGPRAILCRAVLAEIVPRMNRATRGGGVCVDGAAVVVLGRGGSVSHCAACTGIEPAPNPFQLSVSFHSGLSDLFARSLKAHSAFTECSLSAQKGHSAPNDSLLGVENGSITLQSHCAWCSGRLFALWGTKTFCFLLHARIALHELVCDGFRLRSQEIRPSTAPPRVQLQLPGDRTQGAARGLYLTTNRSAQDSPRPERPSMEQVALAPPIPFPMKQQYTDGQSWGPFIGLHQIASLPRQAAPAYIVPRNVVVNGVPCSSTERLYWTSSWRRCCSLRQPVRV